MSDPGDELTIAAAAAALTKAGDKISRQGLSKYCEAHGLKLETPRGPRVSLAAVRAHRADNYQREVMTGGVAIPAAPATADSLPAARPQNPAPPPADGNVVSLDPSRRLKQLQVEEAEIKNAQLRGEIVQIDEVTAGIAEAIVLMRQAGFQSISDAAAQLAAELSLGGEDERIIRAAIKQHFRETLGRFISEAGSRLAAMSGERDDKIRARLDAVTAYALRQRTATGAAPDAESLPARA